MSVESRHSGRVSVEYVLNHVTLVESVLNHVILVESLLNHVILVESLLNHVILIGSDSRVVSKNQAIMRSRLTMS